MPSTQHRAPHTPGKTLPGPRRFGSRPIAHWLAALLAGGLHTLAFAPTPHGGWLQLPLLGLLFWLTSRASGPLGALATGWAFGFGNFVTGVYWVYISMYVYGGMPAPLAGGALVLFALYLGIFPGLATGAWHAVAARWGRTGTSASVPTALSAVLSAAAFGSAWALCEWLKGTLFTGFPWLSSGYAQVDGPLGGVASVIGVYGVGFAAATVGALLAQAVAAVLQRRLALTGVTFAIALLIAVAAVGTASLRFTTQNEAPLTVRLLQGNIPQDIKFEQTGLDHSIDLYRQLILEKPADLIITPETALPILIDDTPVDFAVAVRDFVDRTGSSVLLGAAGVLHPDGVPAYTNSVFGVTPNSKVLYRYDKHHLVPFGEFVPWGFHWFVNLMNMPLGDFARGPIVQTPFVVKGERFSVDICYEDIFGEDIAESLRGQAEPASVLVNSTNLGWFGNSIALDQHLQIARMRALETQRPVLRATNTGSTAAIGPDGSVRGRLKPFTVGSLDTTVQGTNGLTPYVRFGNAPILALALGLLGLAVLYGFANRRRNS